MAKKGELTKNMILQAANQLFAEKGFKDVTMSDICDRTGLSRGGLYRHYASTSDIFKELISNEYTFDDRIESQESAMAILEDSLDILEQEIMQQEKSLSLAIYEYANIGNHSKDFLDLEKKAKAKWVNLIDYGIRTGEFNQVSSEAVAEMILYYYQGLRMWSRVINIGSESAEFYRNNIIHILTGGR